ncbi:uncharacterized protein LOC131254257 [Magnolia sinica]|uniref:uncharacterized protein LOC131254257 n=1 Tax=Magnolia sinica TaxID=86752 RepID=UPI002658C19C|nr:uncharacterized protein LOC131254257 [Magnolia sinica]
MGIHADVQAKLHILNDKYKEQVDKHQQQQVFKVGDNVMVHLCKERFLTGTSNKLKNKKIGLVPILPKINDNAYIVDLLYDIEISRTFNVTDLTEYHEPKQDDNIRTSSFEVEETDAERVIDAFMMDGTSRSAPSSFRRREADCVRPRGRKFIWKAFAGNPCPSNSEAI